MRIKSLQEVFDDERYKDYYVTDEGDIYSSKIRKEGYGKKVNLSKNVQNGYMYFNFSVKINGKRYKRHTIHRLVALAFIPNPSNFKIVNHIDENPSNNHYINLEWCTLSHNSQHSFSLHPDKMEHIRGLSKEDVEFVLKNYDCNNPKISGVALGKKFGVTRNVIYNIIRGKTYKNLVDNPRKINYKHSSLTDSDVIFIRTHCKYGDSKFGYRGLGKKFGVDKGTIRQICENRTWNHLPPFEELNIHYLSSKNTCDLSQEQTISSPD